MYVCANIKYIHIFVYMHVCIHACMYVRTYVSMYLCINVSMHLCICVSVHLCICVAVHLCIWKSVYLCIYVSMYLCMYEYSLHQHNDFVQQLINSATSSQNSSSILERLIVRIPLLLEPRIVLVVIPSGTMGNIDSFPNNPFTQFPGPSNAASS